MSPAKLAGGQQVWTRDNVKAALRTYARLYGDDFTTASFNTATAKWRDREDLIDAYYRGNPDTGGPWPSLNAIKGLYDGSFNAARVDAGFPANRPGPASRRKAHAHAPVRGVRDRIRWMKPERVVERVERVVDSEQVDRLRAQATKAEQRLAASVETLRGVRARARAAEAEVRRLSGQVRRLEASVAASMAEAATSKDLERLGADLDQARTAARLAREQAGVIRDASMASVHMAERERDLAIDRARELEAVLALGDPEELARTREEVSRARSEVAAARETARDATGRAVVAERAEKAAERRALKAEHDAAVAEGQRKLVTAAAAGHDRPLTSVQLDALRSKGPHGPAVFTAAVKEVAKAQARGQRANLKLALGKVAAAAVGWSARL